MTVTGTVADLTSSVVRLQAQVDNGPLSDVSFASGTFQYTTALPLDGSADGPHRVDLIATDLAGNVSTAVERDFTLNCCGFANGLANWNVGQTGGSAAGQGGVTLLTQNGERSALLREGNSFNVTLSESFIVPAISGTLSFTYANLNFDATAVNTIKDAFEADLVDSTDQTLVHPFASGREAFFNITEGLSAAAGPETTISGQTITVDLWGVTPGTQATLILRLVNNDSDQNTSVQVTCVNLPAGAEVVPPVASNPTSSPVQAPIVAATPLIVSAANAPSPATTVQGTGITVTSPLQGDQGTAGSTIVVAGQAVAALSAADGTPEPGNTIINVTLNGTPVDALDAAGDFFCGDARARPELARLCRHRQIRHDEHGHTDAHRGRSTCWPG